MDSPTGFDDDEFFFGSYDANHASVEASDSPLEFDAPSPPPTAEERAHFRRFRRPVAGIVAGMALLSLIALGVHGSPGSGSQRELVAHYNSALAAPAMPAAASTATIQAAIMPQPSSDLVPDAWSALATEVWSALAPEESSAVNAVTPALVTSAPAPALDLVPPDTEFTAFFTQPSANLIKAFSSAPSAMCLRPAQSSLSGDGPNDTNGSALNPISVPMTIEEPRTPAIAPAKQAAIAPAKPLAIAPAKPPAIAPAKPVAIAPAKPPAIAPAKPVAIMPAKPAASAAPPHAPFNSVARFPDAQR